MLETSFSKKVLETDDFECVHMTSYDEFHLLRTFEVFDDFKIDPENPWSVAGLQDILNNHVIDLEIDNRLRTYLIFEKQSHRLVCVFCIKTGDMYLGTSSVPSIELAYFALEKSYKTDNPELKGLGRYCFNAFVIPVIENIFWTCAGKFLYLFAINNNKLVKFYKSLGFEELAPDQEQIVLEHSSNESNKDCKFLYIKLIDYL